LRIELPWPDARLNPNRSKGRHWAHTADLRGRARRDAWVLTHQAARSGKPFEVGVPVALSITFVQPDRRQRDRDNLLAAMKPSLDGIADALGINDYQFDPITIRREYGAKPGAVIVEVGDAVAQ
jgi:crossover junction endodeoxyribonuclease RusA